MKENTFTLKEDYIELIRLLKFLQWAESGSHAKMMVEEGLVAVDGKTELRKRAKLRKGQVITVEDQRITLV